MKYQLQVLINWQSWCHWVCHQSCLALNKGKNVTQKTLFSLNLLQVGWDPEDPFQLPKRLQISSSPMVPIYLQGKMEHWTALKTYLTLQAKGIVTKAAWMFLFKMILQQARIALSKNVSNGKMFWYIQNPTHHCLKLFAGFLNSFFFFHNKTDNKAQKETWNQLLNNAFRTKQKDKRLWNQTA